MVELQANNREVDSNKLSDEEVREAMSLYCEKVKNDIFKEVERDTNIVFTDPNLKGVLNYFMDIALTKGMEMGGDLSLITSYYRDQKDLEGLKPQQYIFELSKGVSGALLPNGEFIKCGNAEHYLIMGDIPLETQHQSIYFSSFIDGVRTNGNISYSPMKFNEATQEQRDWILENKIYFDDGQIQCYLLNKKNGIF